MISKIFKQILGHKLLTGIILVLIIGGGYFGYQKLAGNKNTVRYVTAAVEKGTLIVSVSGSGQVTVLDQVDVKPKVSGEIIALYINKDENVKAGQLLAVLDSSEAQRAVSEAEVALESAKIKLGELLSQPEAKSLLEAENALAQAERDLEKAKQNYETIEADAERTLSSAYEQGYSDVSTAFFKLSDYMKDLRDVLGTEKSEQEYISSYKLLLGQDSPFIQKLLDDYYRAYDLYNKNFTFFREVLQDDNRETIYQLINDTLETTKAISRAFESARHMYDAIVVGSYTQYRISSTIDKMYPKIQSDLSSVYSTINSLQKTIDTIDDTIQNTPDKIKDAGLAFRSAEEKLEDKKLALEKLKAGADPLDIKSQQNIIAQREAALASAKERLANCFIRAPFDGIVAEVKAKKGDSVSTGTVLASVITQQKIAKMSLNEVDAANIKVGQKATLAFDALPELSISGKVIEIDAVGQVSQGVVSYGIKIAFDTDIEQVRPGMSVTADIITDARQDVLVLPNSAIKFQGNSYYVESVVEAPDEMRQQLLANVSGTVLSEPPKLQTVEIGLSNDLSTEIVSGLKEGDIVVTSAISPNAVQTTQTRTTQTQGFQIPGMGGQQMKGFR